MTCPLPALPNLQQQKTLAKELLEAWRTGAPAAIARLREHHQQYRGQNEDEIPASELKLADAQHVIARECGFASWPRYKIHINQLKSRQRNDEVLEFIRAVTVGDHEEARSRLAADPQLARQDVAEDNEHRALHFAVRKQDAQMVQLLVDHGADPDQGVYPRREATTARALARDRGYEEISAIFDVEDETRRQAARCPNLTVTAAITELADLVKEGEDEAVIGRITGDRSLVDSCDEKGETVLHHAARWGRVDLVNRLIDAGAHLNKMNVDGTRALDIAVRMPGADELRDTCVAVGVTLLKQADIIVSLPTAVALGDIARVRQMADHEPERFRPDVKRRCGLLQIAVRHHQLDTLKLLLDLGCDPDDRHQLLNYPGEVFSWGEPLWLAAGESQYDDATALLAAGADPNGQSYGSGDPVSRAYNNRDRKMIDLLLSRGGAVDLVTAVLEGDAEQASGLLDAGVDDPMRVLGHAIDGGNPVIVERLLTMVAPGELVDGSCDLLSECMRWWRRHPHRKHPDFDTESYFVIAQMLLDAGVDVNGKGRWNYTALHDLVFMGNCWGQILSTSGERERFGRLLLDHGANLNARDDEILSTPLAWAARWNRIELVKLFLEYGAAVNLPDDEPWATPLAWAEKCGNTEVAEILREHGAKA